MLFVDQFKVIVYHFRLIVYQFKVYEFLETQLPQITSISFWFFQPI